MPDPAGGDIRRWRPTRWLPAALLLAVGVAAALLVDADAALAALARHRAEALAWVALHPLLAVACYLAVYVAVVALSVPGAGALTLAGGVLFGTVAGGLYSVAAATTGATLLFLVVRRTTLRLPAGRWRGAVARMERGFGRHAFTYLLALRLAPIVPFWLVNLVPAVLGVGLRTFIVATLVGIAPGAMVFASAGAGLGQAVAVGRAPGAALLADPLVLGPLLGLAALALLPVAVARLTRRDQD